MNEKIIEITLLAEKINAENPVKNNGEANIEVKSINILAVEKSITQNEYYKARDKGFRPERCLVINSFEYSGERICCIGQERFEIYRTYEKPTSEKIEIYIRNAIK